MSEQRDSASGHVSYKNTFIQYKRTETLARAQTALQLTSRHGGVDGELDPPSAGFVEGVDAGKAKARRVLVGESEDVGAALGHRFAGFPSRNHELDAT